MLSMAQNHFTPMFNALTSDARGYFGGEYASPPRIQTSGLETMMNGQQYALQHAQSLAVPGNHQMLQSFTNQARPRRYTYEYQPQGIRKDARQRSLSVVADGRSSSGPVRRRISRACDQCNQLRTKCDGMNPCSHCVDFSLTCEYFRERKKRGKASRKDIAAQQQAAEAAAAATAAPSTNPSSPTRSASASPKQLQQPIRESNRLSPARPSPGSRTLSTSDVLASQQQDGTSQTFSRANSMSVLPDHVQFTQVQQMDPIPESQELENQRATTPGSVHSYVLAQEYASQPMAPVSMDGRRASMHAPVMQISQPMENGTPYNYIDATFDIMNSQEPQNVGIFPFSRAAENNIAGFMPTPPMSGSESWFSMASPTSGQYTTHAFPNINTLRYPVLQSLMPKLSGILPASLACELLELYFTSLYSTHNHPLSPYVLGYVFRKHSFLHPTRPRKCSPALLASMLWVAAQTSDATFLSSSPAARGKVCQKLLELTISLLRPLIHGPEMGAANASSYNVHVALTGIPSGGFGVLANDEDLAPGSGCTGSGSLDDVVTYMHLATVVSASEHKAASLRWWNAAWSLARELKLGQELPTTRAAGQSQGADGMNMGTGEGGKEQKSPDAYSEEEREERRRVWWLLYTVDRHLALCYNRPLALLDAECIDLLQPVDDMYWQAGDYYASNTSTCSDGKAMQPPRRRGPSFECTSHSIFGFFTPLMTILGEIVELNQARKHPTLGLASRSASEWDDQSAEITRQLEGYGRSLKQFEMRINVHSEQQETGTPRPTENVIQTKKVVAYGTHVMQVLHILLTGKWDPISLLDDSDLWITSQSFVHSTQRAVAGAEAVSQILEYDPDLGFMPFFFGIYLLQGSFILLLIADRLQAEASPSVVSACEAVVRAVEACVVTLNTEYQRNFRKVLRSALAQVKGHIPEDFGEQQQRRREILALYRWTGDGTGLAL